MKREYTVVLLLLASISAFAGSSGDSAFIDSLMSVMTLEEKIGQLNLPVGDDIESGTAKGADFEKLIINGQLGGFFNVSGVDKIKKLQQAAVEKGPHGIPLLVGADVIHGYRTIFPIPLGLASSWSPENIKRMARISAIEATADGINWNFSPMVDICRDPRWGRIAEGSGEDPYLGSQLAKAYVEGYQGDDLKSDSTLMACVKHFALYGAAEGGRDYNTVDMGKERLFNYYLPPYKAAVDAGCGSLMTSFNLINGQHSTAAGWLTQDLLRDNWNFGGLVVTDYNSMPEIATMGTSTIEDAAAKSMMAGTDMDMVSGLFVKYLKKSLTERKISMDMIDRACRRVLEVKQKLGLFDDPYKYCNSNRADKELFTKSHRAVARDIAAETFVLLKNENKLLPLNKKGKIALIGPLADVKNNMCGCWAMAGEHVTVLEGFRRAVGKRADILYAKGSNIYHDATVQMNGSGIKPIPYVEDEDGLLSEAIMVAEKSDVIVAVMGESSEMSGESASRADITIPDAQRELLKRLVKTGKPVVLVLFTGRPLVLDWESENIPAILNVWFPGSEAGDAIADVVFGNKNPEGKLTATFPRSVGQIPLYYNHLMPSHPDPDSNVFNRYCSNYIDCSNEPLYPFGYGLSYTEFKYGKPELSADAMERNGSIRLSVDVTNTGNMDGTEIVQLYLRDVVADIARPVKELKDFVKIYIPKGKTRKVEFVITPDKLKYYDSELKYRYDPGEFEVMVGSDSKNLQTMKFIVK